MKKSSALLVFVSAALFFGFGQAAPTIAQSYPSSQCTSISGGYYASDAGSCSPGDISIGSYLSSACVATGVCCVPSGTAAPTPQSCTAQPCTSIPNGVCGYFIPSGYTPASAGTCPSGQQCFIPGAGGTCASQGGVCVVGTCSQQSRRSATGSCIGPDATKECCTAQTFPSCAGACRTGSCNSDERADGNAVCADASATCCTVNPATLPGTVTGPLMTDYQLLEQVPGSSNTVGRLNTYLDDIYRFAFWTVGIAVVFMLTIGGFMYLTSAGYPARVATAKTVIFDAILGLVLALVAWLFLYVVNPDLVNVRLPSASITPAAAPAAAPPAGSATRQFTSSQCAAVGGAYASGAADCTTVNPGYFSIGDHVNSSGVVNGVCCAGTTPAPAPTGAVNTLAQQILAGGNGITLSGAGSCSTTGGPVSPSMSIQQAAAGSPVTRCQNGCPGTGSCTQTTTLSDAMLRGLIQVAGQYPLTVSSVTGGSHSTNSAHYAGRAVDVVPSVPKAQWPQVQAAFRATGASLVICDITVSGQTVSIPCDDARADHVHIQW